TVDYLKKLPYVDPASIVTFGCSGGGDLVLQAAAETDVAVVAAEEPATGFFTGMFDASIPKHDGRYAAEVIPELMRIEANPERYYTAERRKMTRERIERIDTPILIV